MSTPDPDDRPRPQYGEYASPEEQRARIRQPDATDALLAGQALDAPATSASAPPATLAEQTRRTTSAPSTSALARPLTGWRLADRIITIGLLAYGLVNVIATSVQLFSFEQYANTILGLFGVDQAFTNVAQGQLWGTVAGITMIVGWLLTATLTWRQLRRGRIAFWIPVAGALVVSIAVSIFITVPILNDPAFSELFNQVATSGS
ncbi:MULTISPECIES: DUF6264 family protein [unclassified Microbacterium]|uniref:DUF6264 family protein n=1 Tax=unclassified Microbacterium TaxID=2609290 RepID=UPI000D56E528|nr:DUF6264 family protein [Microbacterium sp. Gd 4-13]PVW06229.1 hypothetical protein DEA06_01405 [Microbacterium sp. Gd 4-13]